MQTPTIEELKRALHIQENIEELQKELASIFGRASAKVLGVVESGLRTATRGIQSIKVGRKKSKMSKAGREAIAAAQRKRWAKVKGKAAAKPTKKRKGKMSAAGRAAIVAAQKKRWAKVKAGKAKAAKPKAKTRKQLKAVKAAIVAAGNPVV